MSDETNETKPTENAPTTPDGIIPILTVDGTTVGDGGPFMPRALADDPDTGDGSTGRDGVPISSWRLQMITYDRLHSAIDPSGGDRRSRKTRRAHEVSRAKRNPRRRVLRRRWRVVLGLVVVAAVIGAAYVGISYAYEDWGGKSVPYVSGLTQANATELLEEKGFRVSAQGTVSDIMEGHVLSVEPAEGKRVDEGTEVHLTVSQSRLVPEVVGMNREEAESTLEAAGATNIRFVSRVDSQEENKVLEVQPAAGSVFMSTQEVKLVVSQQARVPDVVGQEENAARSELEREGIYTSMEYERSTVANRFHVVRTEPGAGEVVGEGGVTMYVGDPLVSVARLLDYYDAKGPHIVSFLGDQGYTAKAGHLSKDNRIVASFQSADNTTVSFVPDPWTKKAATDKTPDTSILDEGAQLDGVRLVIDLSKAKAGTSVMGIKDPVVGETTAKDVMELCGFSNMAHSCTQSTITLPKGTSNIGHEFYCCSGESGSNVWTVLVRGTSGKTGTKVTEIVASCAPKGLYAAQDLSVTDGSICNYFAYKYEYQG